MRRRSVRKDREDTLRRMLAAWKNDYLIEQDEFGSFPEKVREALNNEIIANPEKWNVAKRGREAIIHGAARRTMAAFVTRRPPRGVAAWMFGHRRSFRYRTLGLAWLAVRRRLACIAGGRRLGLVARRLAHGLGLRGIERGIWPGRGLVGLLRRVAGLPGVRLLGEVAVRLVVLVHLVVGVFPRLVPGLLLGERDARVVLDRVELVRRLVDRGRVGVEIVEDLVALGRVRAVHAVVVRLGLGRLGR